jgi:NAD+ kinase
MKFGIIGNLAKESLTPAVVKLLGASEKRPVEFILDEELAKLVNKESGKRIVLKKQAVPVEELVANSDMLIAFGGDGTILSAARLVGRASVPILGVNLGKLGFLAELSVDEIELFVDDILNGQHVVQERMVVKATIEGVEQQLFGLNDIVVDKSGSSRVINVEVHVNNDYLATYTGDGIVIATPTGTTGYSLAAGGPIVIPSSDVLTISPISPHTLAARSVVVPDTSTIRIVVETRTDAVRITADGQQEKLMKPPATLFVQKADYTIKLVKRKDKTYYDVLRRKLMLGKDVRFGRVD